MAVFQQPANDLSSRADPGRYITLCREAARTPPPGRRNGTHVKKGEIENSIIMEGCVIEIGTKIIDSVVGAHTEITTNQKGPKGHKLIVGENSKIIL